MTTGARVTASDSPAASSTDWMSWSSIAVSVRRVAAVAHLLDDEHRRVLIEHLVDRDHHAHLHQGLDDLIRLDRHALRELADRDRGADLDVANDGRRRLLEAVLRIRR